MEEEAYYYMHAAFLIVMLDRTSIDLDISLAGQNSDRGDSPARGRPSRASSLYASGLVRGPLGSLPP